MVLGLGRSGERTEGPAVETALEGDDFVLRTSGVQAHELDRRFVGLGARIAKERLAAKAPLRERLGPPPLQFRIPGVRDVDQHTHLPAHGLNDRFGAMPKRLQPQPGKKSR